MTRSPFESDNAMPERDDHTPRDEHDEAPGTFEETADGLGELALRRLLHDAVRDLEPREEALDRLVQEIPARRVRRRQTAVGAAASILLAVASVPAFLHVSQFGGSDTAGTVSTSAGFVPGSSPDTFGVPQPGASGRNFGQYPGAGLYGIAPVTGTARPRVSAPGVIAASTPPGAPVTGGSPACARVQLGRGSAHTAAADEQGRVYGSFKVTNVSASSCTVSGDGQITVTAQGSTDPTKIEVVDHTAGDPATDLPDPASEPDSVVLIPGQAYQVQFAWIPAPGGGTTGCAAEPTPPTDGGSDDSGGLSGIDGSGSSNAAAAVSTDGGGTPYDPPPSDSASPTPSADGIALADVPPGGGPSAASTTITGACAGTVYRTNPLPAPQ
jgi:hypothetical protein